MNFAHEYILFTRFQLTKADVNYGCVNARYFMPVVCCTSTVHFITFVCPSVKSVC